MVTQRVHVLEDHPRLGHLGRLLLLILVAIAVVLIGVFLLFKGLDFITQTPGGTDGHMHIL